MQLGDRVQFKRGYKHLGKGRYMGKSYAYKTFVVQLLSGLGIEPSAGIATADGRLYIRCPVCWLEVLE